MSLLFIVLVGGLLGWLASPSIRGGSSEGRVGDVMLGAVGALAGGFALTPLLGNAALAGDRITLAALLVALAGTTVTIAFAAVARRNRARQRRMNPPTSRKASTTSTRPTIKT
ncbi:MAG: GlsB/YeaQ/YmgE family stress response membrane protein [Novosphingobium sp.]